ncbi:alpha-L-arabinofuranosidase [Opitutaceae bacterium TAV1]|nr:alpha-L-arabinofuranosidase [Opitutaceae bacterium TAV1]
MILPRLLLATAAALLAGLAPALASPLPAPSLRTVVVAGADLAAGLKVDTRQDPAALGGAYVSPREKYQTIARVSLPAEGDTLHVWVHYRGLALQVKTRLGDKTVGFPWSWQRNAKDFAWRLAGSFKRDQLGDSVWLITDPKFTEASGVDALVVTADTDWKPVGVTNAAATPAKPAPPAANPDEPDAANATVQAEVAVIEETSESGEATVSINWGKTGEHVSPLLYSLNGLRRAPDPTWEAGIALMRPPLIRQHSSSLARSWFVETADGKVTWDYAKVRATFEASRPPAGTFRMHNVNIWPASWDADEDGRLDPDRVDDFARLYADLVRFVNIEMKAGIQYWEITNEKDMPYWRKPRKDNTPDVAALARVYNTTAAAIRAVDPTVKIGGPAACSPLPMGPLVEFARLTRDQLDFFSFHHYATGNNTEPDQVIYEKAFVMADDARNLIRRIDAVMKGKVIEYHLNEFNICYSWRKPEPRMTNHKGAVFDALSLIAYTRVPGLTATNAWGAMDRVYGKMDQRGSLRPGAYVYHYFNRLLSGRPAAVTTSADKAVVPFAVADGHEGRPAFVLVNRTNGEQTVTFTESPAQTGSWQVAVIDAGGPRPAAPAAPFKAPVTLSPHSVNFYWLD